MTSSTETSPPQTPAEGDEPAIPPGVDRPTVFDWMLFTVARPLVWLLGALPLTWTLAAARLAADISFRLGFWREIPRLNLEYIFPEKDEQERRQIAWLANRSTFQTMVELVAYLNPKRKALDYMVIEHLDAIAEAVASGRGILLIVAHSANMDLTGRAWAELGYDAHAVVKPLKGYYWNDLLLSCRAANGYNVISTKHPDAIEQINAAVRSGSAVGLFPDQNARKKGIVCDFLGKPASTYKGAAATYLELNPVLLIAVDSRPHSDHRHLCRVRILDDIPLSGDREQDLTTVTSQINATMSELILMDPTCYMWAHRRWGRYRDGVWVAG